MKKLKWLIALVLTGGVGWVAFNWYQSRGVSGDALSFIPPDAIYCITTSDPIGSWKMVASSAAWAHLQGNEYFASLTASANSLDSIIHKNDLLFELIGSRALVVSAHITEPKKYDFLFLVDLKEVSGIKFLNEYLTAFSTSGFSVRKEKYGKDDLIILRNTVDNSSLYLSLPGAYLLASFNKKIITASLDTQLQSDSLAIPTLFKPGLTAGISDIFQLYLNYKRLPQLVACYMSGPNEYVDRLSQALQTTSLNVTLEDELIKATGHTYLQDSVESYLQTLAMSGRGPYEFAEIAPQRTAFAMALGFTSFKEFFTNLEKNVQQDVAEYNTYRSNLKQVEDYLNIDLQEHFIDWVGDEMALLELQSYGEGLNNETAIIFKTDNIEKAKKDLDYIEKRVRKKTPVKFKTVEYRGYAIRYLHLKGLFKLVLGKFFSKYDKPYYTIINNFVIFSNHPQTLQSMIDDYLNKKTLIKSDEFRQFKKEFEDEGNVFVYINTPVFFNAMKKLVDTPTRISMEKNKEYIVCFRQVGIQLVPEEGGFKTLFAEQFVQPEKITEPAPELSTMDSLKDEVNRLEEEVTEIPKEDKDPMSLPYIYANDVNTSTYSGYFPDSTLRFKVEMKNGFKNGDFTEYFQNGELKMKGRFKDGKRNGTWRLYDENGKLILKRTYENDEMTKEKSNE
jgi:hypothetical protein